MSMGSKAREYFESLQGRICEGLERIDGKAAFHEDRWRHEQREDRPSAGGGVTRVLSDGRLFEKAGVNSSAVSGMLSEKLASRMNVTPRDFFATGVSVVIHPYSPMVPTVHVNLRYIELETDEKEEASRAWFGGGADLTPCYLYNEDAVHFHRTWKSVCDRHDPEFHTRFKKWCDDYFFIRHRGEARGIGGIFFDYLKGDLEKIFAFVKDAGDAFLDSYLPIVDRRCEEPWTEKEKRWQLIRRGRYVEFNLVYDRGTLFGLETQGRIESILISLPPLVKWPYDFQAEPGSREAALIETLKNPVSWV